jgi:hypothetical protein
MPLWIDAFVDLDLSSQHKVFLNLVLFEVYLPQVFNKCGALEKHFNSFLKEFL